MYLQMTGLDSGVLTAYNFVAGEVSTGGVALHESASVDLSVQTSTSCTLTMPESMNLTMKEKAWSARVEPAGHYSATVTDREFFLSATSIA